MGLFDQFPYTNFHELNLMWILEALKEIQTTTEQFVAINSLKYANPIQWNITSQYEKNTIVIDPQTGTAYISVQPVPTGVALTNEDYWTVVFDLGSFVTRAAKNLTSRYEESTTLTATFPTNAGDWLVWNDTLYVALTNIIAGDSYIINSNIRHFTIEDITGHIEDLLTTDKTNLVAAINEIVSNTGDLNDLDTTDKTNLVAAINEVLLRLTTTTGDLNDLDTTDKTNLVAAINEIVSNTGDLNDLDTTDKTNLVAAINEVLSRLTTTTGDLNDLDTTDKTNLVAAINEINTNTDNNTDNIGDLNDLDTTDKTNLVAAINELGIHVDTVYPLPVVDATKHGVSTENADNSAALNACINQYGADYEIYLPAGEYKFQNSVYLGNRARFKCDGTMKFTQALGYGLVCMGYDQIISISDVQAVAEAVVLRASNDTIGRSVYFLPRIVSTSSDALTLIASGTNTGVGVQKCDFYLNSISAGRNGIWLYPESPTYADWVNENNFYNAWITAPHAIVISKGTNQTDPANGNRFINFSTENSPESIQCHFARYNKFINMRSGEIYGTGNQIFMDAQCMYNEIITDAGLRVGDISDVGSYNKYHGLLYTNNNELITDSYTFFGGEVMPLRDLTMCDHRWYNATNTNVDCGTFATNGATITINDGATHTLKLPRMMNARHTWQPFYLIATITSGAIQVQKQDGTVLNTINSTTSWLYLGGLYDGSVSVIPIA